MKTSVVNKLAVSALVLATAAIGCKPATDAHPTALSASTPEAAKGAAVAAGQAQAALAKKQIDKAVVAAERAVALQPQDARYRLLLGRTYLAAGRFASAETSFADALELDPAGGQAPISLALAQIATGDSAAARTTLGDAAGKVADADRGLALALAGDANGAVEVLEGAARAPGANAKTRQNLALAYALAGEWAKAQITAGQDLSPALVDARMVEWAKFARRGDPRAQVASLLGVMPAADAGLPAQLALIRQEAPPVETAAVAAPAPVARPPAVVETPPFAVAAAAAVTPVPIAPSVAPADFASVAPKPALPPLIRAPRTGTKSAFASPPRIPALLASPRPIRTVAYRPAQRARGGWVVQLGAYAQLTTVERAWGKVSARSRILAAYAPSQSVVTTSSATLHRLVLAGFANRDAAVQVCLQVRAAGGDCFVRASAGEAPVRMAARAKPVQLASS